MKSGTKVLIPVIVMAAMAGTAFLLPGFPWLSGEPVLANDSISDGQRAEIAAILEAMAANGQFSGTVLVSVRGEEIYSGAFGLADIERGVPNRIDTQFRGRERRCWRRSPGGIWCSSRGPETSTATTASSSSAQSSSAPVGPATPSNCRKGSAIRPG